MGNTSRSYYGDYEEEYIFSDPKLQVILFVLYSVVFFLCFFGNLTVVIVMCVHRKMRGPTKFCIGNLAFANLCVSIFCIYQDLSTYLIDNWLLGDILCKMYHFTNSVTHTASTLILVVIAIERYFAILYPFRCRQFFTTRKLRLIILGVWVLSGVICSHRLFYIGTIGHVLPGKDGKPKSEVICALNAIDNWIIPTVDTIQFVLLFLLPLLVISIAYTKIVIFLRKREKFVCSFAQRSSILSTDSEQENQREESTKASLLENPSRSVSFTLGDDRQEITQDRIAKHFWDSTFSTSSVIPNGIVNGRSRWRRIRRAVLCRQENLTNDRSISFHGELNRNSSVGSISVPNPHKGVVKMLVAIVVIFAVCNFPFHLRKIYQNFFNNEFSYTWWAELPTPLSLLLMYCNCAINPIIYSFMSPNFRSCFRDCIQCRVRGTQNSV